VKSICRFTSKDMAVAAILSSDRQTAADLSDIKSGTWGGAEQEAP